MLQVEESTSIQWVKVDGNTFKGSSSTFLFNASLQSGSA